MNDRQADKRPSKMFKSETKPDTVDYEAKYLKDSLKVPMPKFPSLSNFGQFPKKVTCKFPGGCESSPTRKEYIHLSNL